MKATRTVYVCSNNCGIAYHHPLQFCPRCPGKLVRTELSWDIKANPRGYFEGKDGGKRYKEWLKQHGLKLLGEE